MISMAGLLHGTSALRKSQALDEARRVRPRTIQQKSPTDWNQFAGRNVLGPVIRYFALAFIFFQVATTAALATQVVLFAGEAADMLPLAEPASAALTLPISPQVGEMAGRPEGGATEHLLIHIDPGKQSQASPME
ncbi:MAG: hypothetical protein E5W93_02840 [Mesorhizobium sp.]|nr:MAG: hypothetical protein E5W93_02840 [Mesorhizobium sp.]